MAILCGPAVTHHPSCPARYDAQGCICPPARAHGEEGTVPAAANPSAAAGTLSEAALLAAEQASIERYLDARQQRVETVRFLQAGAA